MSENPDTPKKSSVVTGADIAQTEQERIRQEFLMEAQEETKSSTLKNTGEKSQLFYDGKPIPYRKIGEYFEYFEGKAISAERVQQLERRAMAKLKRQLENDPYIQEYLEGTKEALRAR
jgi:DNA-directed RNA polymerase sigma subunit (sigma70/sigma32)